MQRLIWVMPDSAPLNSSTAAFDTSFHTDWLVVQTAALLIPEAEEAMEQLCRTYWFPLYAYVRRRGHSPQDAQDLTQEFFARLLARPWLQDVHPSKGRFRSFLLASMNHFLAKEWRRAHTEKRGGGCVVFSLDSVEAEDRYRIEPADHHDPDRLYARHWARTLLDRVRTRLQQECVAADKRDLFEELKPRLDGEEKQASYAEMAGRLGMSEAAVKKAAQRLRERYQALLCEEIARTVSEPGEIDGEIRHLFAALQD